MLKTNEIYCGNCLEVMKEVDSNSIDAIVTDPPYELGFMGKSWDKTGIANNVEVWKQALRVLKPGGYVLSFGGSRTYHRMACAIEDAGFQIRDMVEWVYGSGFPKSHNIGKAVDKLRGNEREITGKSIHPTSNDRTGNKSPYQAEEHLDSNFNLTKGTSDWEGWGTALKPSHEPICMARKPLSEKTVAKNVLKWGTGGINIDECRVEGQVPVRSDFGKESNSIFGINSRHPDGFREGRFPANLIHDGSDEVVGMFPDTKSGKEPKNGYKRNKSKDYQSNVNYADRSGELGRLIGDSGSAARFFYCAKSSKAERGEGNNHPCVKPIKLLQYLIKLVTTKDAIVLDPFAGSGSTLIAAKQLNRNYIGIEMSEEYCKIAYNRLKEVKND